MALDMKQRESLARVDDDDRRRKIGLARDIIYKQRFAVGTTKVDDLLMEQSLVPTDVSSRTHSFRRDVNIQ
jgi:hypothetical protein